MIDLSTEFGKRALRRLQAASTIWLTTVSQDGTPQPRPVWFFWTGETFLIFSRPEGAKLRHIARNSRVALHLTAMDRR
jgi:PPOX class probable F420-dependent enzyme